MKIFLSDLHLGDGKERDDFQYLQQFEDLVKKLSEEFAKVEMILLGDIFDLIRTQKYYEVEGLPHAEIKLKVMEDIAEQHATFFETLRHFTEKGGNRLRYVVGNHDFGTYLDLRLLEILKERFGLSLEPEILYRDQSLRIWAEHGHRYDVINTTFNEDGTPIEYCLGDRIVVEIVDKFFDKVRRKRSELGIDPEIINDLDNVRPQTAIPDWLDSIDDEGRLRQMYYDRITEFIVTHPGEMAHLVLDLIAGKYQPDLVKPAKSLAQNGAGRYILFGHTHDALTEDLEGRNEYLNTGTWRKFIEPWRRYTKRVMVPTYTEGGTQFYEEQIIYRYKFKTTVDLSYVLFYEEGEGEVGPRLVRQEQESK
jgi:UDP-2,3-diacylglucosamine pyrophosphatase LpxH